MELGPARCNLHSGMQKNLSKRSVLYDIEDAGRITAAADLLLQQFGICEIITKVTIQKSEGEYVSLNRAHSGDKIQARFGLGQGRWLVTDSDDESEESLSTRGWDVRRFPMAAVSTGVLDDNGTVINAPVKP